VNFRSFGVYWFGVYVSRKASRRLPFESLKCSEYLGWFVKDQAPDPQVRDFLE
jgi:hypothetical protein